MRAAVAFAVVAVLIAPSQARAQSWEASGLFGFTPSAAIDERASELSDADIRGEITWGVQGAWFFTPSLGAESQSHRHGRIDRPPRREQLTVHIGQ